MKSPNMPSAGSPEARAAEVTADVLRAVHRGEPAVLIDSPPGAGKTTTGIKIAATAWGLLHENAMVACWTNRQAIDFAIRLARDFPKVPVQLFIKSDVRVIVPAEADDLPNLHLVHKTKELAPEGVSVSNSSKWVAYPINHGFEWLLVDEAYQLPEYRFQQLVPLAKRYVMVGDPGQIAPLIQADVSPWGCDPAGPHLPSPRALLARHPSIRSLKLPVSWRLPRDTAEIVRSAFYDFDFASGDPAGLRALELNHGDGARVDAALDRLTESGTSLVAALLPDYKIATDVDPEIAGFAAQAAARLLERGARWRDERNPTPVALRPNDIGIVTAHRAQVAEIEKNLRMVGVPTGSSGVVAETTERWQGLERKVMIVHHPLSGLERVSSFDLDRGRLCVMLSRHSIACLVVARSQIGAAIDMHSHTGERFAGTPDDEYLGWYAHHQIWEHLAAWNRLVEVS